MAFLLSSLFQNMVLQRMNPIYGFGLSAHISEQAKITAASFVYGDCIFLRGHFDSDSNSDNPIRILI